MKSKILYLQILATLLLFPFSHAISEPAKGIGNPENLSGSIWNPTPIPEITPPPLLCKPPSHLIDEVCCPQSSNYLVDGKCSVCPANKINISGICCPKTDKYVVAGKCSICPAKQHEIGGQCCPVGSDYFVDGKCSICPANQTSISGLCCPKSQPYVVAGACSACPVKQHTVGSQCCPVGSDYIVSGQCSVCPANKINISGICCPQTDKYVVGGKCSVCPAKQHQVDGKCCPVGSDHLVAGKCSVCPANQTLISGKCCPKTDKYVVGGKCSVCPAKQHQVNGKCCPVGSDYLVGGKCSVCPANQKSISGKCCPKTSKSVVKGKCSPCTTAQHEVSGICCPKNKKYVYNIKGKKTCSDCASFSITTNILGKGNKNSASAGWVSVGGNAPACLKQEISTAHKNCTAVGYNKYHYLYDSCMYLEYSGYSARTQWASFWSKPQVATLPTVYYKVDENGKCSVGKAPGKVCRAAVLNYWYTPISLLLDTELEDFQKESRIANFSLSPDSGAYTIWKGSAKAPLLVFDPTHNAQVTSASQLFGNWTFGGKKEANLQSSVTDATKSTSSWSNGYEALGTLDTDGDGEISGKELAPLALWFDENRNAISEEGEVRPIQDLGIKVLYYKQYSKDVLSEDLIAKIGFEREVSGELVKGITVDWYGYTANSEVELVQRQLSIKNLCSVDSASLNQSMKQESTGDSDYSSSEVKSKFSGTWTWNSETPEVQSAGILLFADNQKGGIVGMSKTELSAESDKKDAPSSMEEMLAGSEKVNEEDPDEAKRTVVSMPLSAKVENSPDGETLKFSYKLQDGSEVLSTAKLSEDGLTLQGESVASLVSGDNRELKAQYKWSAVRYNEVDSSE